MSSESTFESRLSHLERDFSETCRQLSVVMQAVLRLQDIQRLQHGRHTEEPQMPVSRGNCTIIPFRASAR